jgi:glycosyltransferase involved in cell wall biosynthesis
VKIVRAHAQAHSFIQLFSVPDLGIYDAMNKSILKAKGGWFLFLGSDDFLIDPTVISQLEKTIQINPHVQMIYGDVMNQSLGRKTDGRYGGEFDEVRILRQNICHQAILYRKGIFENGMYELRYRYYADYALNLSFILDAAITKMYIPLVIANFTEGGFSSSVKGDPVFNKEFSALVGEYAKTSFSLYPRKFKFLTTFFHKINKLDGLMGSLEICKNYFGPFKRYAYPAFFFVSIRYFLGLYFLNKK